MKEIFKSIPDLEPYEISNLGRLRRKGKILSTPLCPGGYRRKYLKDLKKNILIHRVLAICFKRNPKNLPCINHKDRNRSNNNLSNLEWTTHQGNIQHAVNDSRKNGGTWVNKGEDSHMAKLRKEHIQLIRDAIYAGFSQRKIAGYFKVTQTTISMINRGLNWASV